MFKKISDKTKELLNLHVAGMTVKHKGRFSDLKVIENECKLDNDFIVQYVVPFYMKKKDTEEFKASYQDIRSQVDSKLVANLLGDFNWRSRSVGAYFAALEGMYEFQENIGNLLLRSDVCYTGHTYCLALASYSTPKGVEYLHQYLNYYLKQKDLWFDQNSAMSALAYLDESENRELLEPHMSSWNVFIENKPNWNLDTSIEGFNEQMETLKKHRNEISS